MNSTDAPTDPPNGITVVAYNLAIRLVWQTPEDRIDVIIRYKIVFTINRYNQEHIAYTPNNWTVFSTSSNRGQSYGISVLAETTGGESNSSGTVYISSGEFQIRVIIISDFCY